MDKSKIIKMLVLLMAITIIAGGLLRIFQRNSMSLAEYEKLNGSSDSDETHSQDADSDDGTKNSVADNNGDGNNTDASASSDQASDSGSSEQDTSSEAESLPDPAETALPASQLIGASLNGTSQTDERVTYEEGFYYEPISDNLRRYVTGISYPGVQTSADDGGSDTVTTGTDAEVTPKISLDELRYVHILHYDFDGNPAEGELICNEYIAQDLVEIFYQLYCNEYRLERVLLIDEYDGDDIASMEDNNTSCFNYRVVAGSSSLSKHAYGLAIDVNPLYNPYITYSKDGAMNVSPSSGESYADRTLSFPYKIDEEDLCYKLFIQHGFTWGGSWNHSKDYQHFQKTKP